MARAHLNGSVNLKSAEEVFALVGEVSGETMARIPDGETTRLDWVSSLVPRHLEVPGVVQVGERQMGPVMKAPVLGLEDGASPEDIDFGAVDFAVLPQESYAVFRRLRDAGRLPADSRFMVAMPTPVAVIGPYFEPQLIPGLVPRMAEHQRREIASIAAAIPHEDLALQWDVAVEIGIATGAFAGLPEIPLEDICAQLARLATFVPADVPLGYHLCYGDPRPEPGAQGQHFVQPTDLGLCVEMANRISDVAGRPIQWYTMPVPIDRDDDAYFAPLDRLAIDAGTEIYLGVVHHEDGLEGSQRRADAARQHLAGFGVCTECGMGRKPREAIRPLLEIQRDLVV
jgi:hypothetical protein